MKLTWVKFDRLMKFENELTSDEAHTDVHGHMEFDTEAQVVSIGNRCFPASRIAAFVKVDCPPCPECQEQFKNSTATAAHRKFAHGVPGKRSAK